MEIERHLSSVPHRAGSAADHATALYVQQRLESDGFATRIQEYQVEFTGPLEQSLTMLSPRHENFDLLEGTPGHHTKWETMAGSAVSRRVRRRRASPVASSTSTRASKDDLTELDAAARQPARRGRAGASRRAGGAVFATLDPSWIAYNELTKARRRRDLRVHGTGEHRLRRRRDVARRQLSRTRIWPNG